MHEDLLGYLLGALEPHEMDQVRQSLRDDPDLQRQLEQIKAMLRPLDEATGRESVEDEPLDDALLHELDRADELAGPDDEAEGWFDEELLAELDEAESSFEPPADLLARTMAAIPDGLPPGDDASLSDEADAAADPLLQAALVAGDSVSARPLNAAGGEKSRSWMWLDFIISGLAATALFGIVLPGVLRGRFEARKVACQDNLRETGVGLTTYALNDPQQQLPQLAAEGNEAFAGFYSVKLHDKQLLREMSQLLCPSLDPPEIDFARPPTMEELRAASGQALLAMQRYSGGSYAYNLGVMSEDRYQSPRYQGRSSFAILADAPVPVATVAMMQEDDGRLNAHPALVSSTSVGRERVQFGHAGRGVNLLFEDGHVIFLPLGDAMMTYDHPFLNHRGEVEAGVNANDATLAPSWRPPFTEIRQR